MNIKMRVPTKGFQLLLLTAIAVFSRSTFAQPQSSSKTNPNLANVEQAVRGFYDSLARGDEAGVLNFIAAEGFSYDRDGFVPAKINKVGLRAMIGLEKKRTKFLFATTDFKIASIGPDASVANYELLMKIFEAGKEETLNSRVTDVLVRRDGKWQILVEHSSIIPSPVKAVIPGLPMNWERSVRSTADRYTIALDSNVTHEGKASASMKFSCGDDQDAWVGLGQPFAAVEFRGHRVRLTGWLKTEDADDGTLWMRVDGERQTLDFDAMVDRSVKGTTDWRMYSVVLDVPPEAKRIVIGAMLWGKGQVWADDLKVEMVDKSVAVTGLLKPEDPKLDRPDLASLPAPTRKRPINLGFEDGSVH